jgi:hypothetical protein
MNKGPPSSLLLLCSSASLVSLFVGCSTMAPNHQSTAMPCSGLEAPVTLKNTSVLLVRLRNLTGQSFTLPRREVPWEWRYAMVIKAFETDAPGTPVEEIYPIADPDQSNIVIPPRGSLSGEIDLADRFPGLDEVLQRRDVIIFWSFQLNLSEKHLPCRYGGWLLINRSGKECRQTK